MDELNFCCYFIAYIWRNIIIFVLYQKLHFSKIAINFAAQNLTSSSFAYNVFLVCYICEKYQYISLSLKNLACYIETYKLKTFIHFLNLLIYLYHIPMAVLKYWHIYSYILAIIRKYINNFQHLQKNVDIIDNGKQIYWFLHQG